MLETANRILDLMRSLRITLSSGQVLQVTASIGVACEMPNQRENHDALIHRADSALYEAKRSGRDRVVAADLIADGDIRHQAGMTPAFCGI